MPGARSRGRADDASATLRGLFYRLNRVVTDRTDGE